MSFFEKAILLYLCFAIGCSFWQPDIVFGNQNGKDNVLTMLFNINSTDIGSGSTTFGSTDLNNKINGQDNQTGNSGLFKVGKDTVSSYQWVVDGLGIVIRIIGIFFQALFSPFIMFFSMVTMGAPVPLMFVFAIPLITMFLVGFLIFIRSGL